MTLVTEAKASLLKLKRGAEKRLGLEKSLAIRYGSLLLAHPLGRTEMTTDLLVGVLLWSATLRAGIRGLASGK